MRQSTYGLFSSVLLIGGVHVRVLPPLLTLLREFVAMTLRLLYSFGYANSWVRIALLVSTCMQALLLIMLLSIGCT